MCEEYLLWHGNTVLCMAKETISRKLLMNALQNDSKMWLLRKTMYGDFKHIFYFWWMQKFIQIGIIYNAYVRGGKVCVYACSRVCGCEWVIIWIPLCKNLDGNRHFWFIYCFSEQIYMHFKTTFLCQNFTKIAIFNSREPGWGFGELPRFTTVWI